MRALLLAALLAAPAAAKRPLTPEAPEFPVEDAWINAKPLTLQLLMDRKAVVVAFINPTGLHTLRELTALKGWYDRYALSQLMVIGVVTPDLEVQKDSLWVKTILKRYGVDFPIIVDGNRKLWKEYQVDGWPTLFLLDRKSHIAFDHLGEGDYAEFEHEMRGALIELMNESDLPPPLAPPEPRTKDCGRATDEIMMGARAKKPPLALDQNYSRRQDMLVDTRDGELSTFGRWDQEPDGLRLAQPNKDQSAFVRVIFSGSQALAVLAPIPTRKARFYVKLDDNWLYEGPAGADVRIDDDGRSYVDADISRLYDLVHLTDDKFHELYVIPETKGAGVYGFTFADVCTATKLP